MNKQEILEKYHIFPTRYQKYRTIDIITTKNDCYVLKKGNYYNIYEYLQTRNFHHLPEPLNDREEEYTIYRYIKDDPLPQEQRVSDFLYLLSILHTKTTFYKTLEVDKIKEIFESIRERQDRLMEYYYNLQDRIEVEKYMAPSHYQLIRGLSLIYYHLTESKNEIEIWYKGMIEKKKMRYVMTHGNLKKEHFIENQELYFISWNQARIHSPVYDLENFYRNNWKDITMGDLLEIYESKYPLTKEEFHLFLSLVLLPQKIVFEDSEIKNTRRIYEWYQYHEQLEEWKKKTRRSQKEE